MQGAYLPVEIFGSDEGGSKNTTACPCSWSLGVSFAAELPPKGGGSCLPAASKAGSNAGALAQGMPERRGLSKPPRVGLR